jgi:hypothetical protein
VGLSTSRDLRCPRCDAHVRGDADWCTLCYADLRPAPEPAAEPAPAAQPEPAAVEPVEAEPDAPELTGLAAELTGLAAELTGLAPGPAASVPGGKHARRAPGEQARGVEGLEGVDVDAMLAQLAAESDSGLGPLAGRLQTKESKAVVIGGGIVVVALVLFVLMAVLGALL